MTDLHDTLTLIDGLVISKWSRAVFADMRKGGLTAANYTCSIWEGFVDTMRNICAMETLVRRQRRPDHSSTHYGQHSPRQSGRENRDHPRLSKYLGVGGSDRLHLPVQGTRRRGHADHLQYSEPSRRRLLRAARYR